MRNQDLKHKRDKRMVEKFHYLYDVKRMRLDDVLKDLSENHFFLDSDYIYSRIFYNKKNKDYYGELLESS
ncbi:MAG: hypothetical protein PF444_07185 [Bacteroidales bacterium]|nr:hypothetical protein [Bacteroidales bacterium]